MSLQYDYVYTLVEAKQWAQKRKPLLLQLLRSTPFFASVVVPLIMDYLEIPQHVFHLSYQADIFSDDGSSIEMRWRCKSLTANQPPVDAYLLAAAPSRDAEDCGVKSIVATILPEIAPRPNRCACTAGGSACSRSADARATLELVADEQEVESAWSSLNLCKLHRELFFGGLTQPLEWEFERSTNVGELDAMVVDSLVILKSDCKNGHKRKRETE